MVTLTTVWRVPLGWHSMTLMSLILGEGTPRIARLTWSWASASRPATSPATAVLASAALNNSRLRMYFPFDFWMAGP